MTSRKSDLAVVGCVLMAVILWGANNVANRYLVQSLPVFYIAWARTFIPGLVLLLLLKNTSWFGKWRPLTSKQKHFFWWKGGFIFALYAFVFTQALVTIPASHVALYLGATPLWGLLWEERPKWNLQSLRKYSAVFLAVGGVVVLFAPSFNAEMAWFGEFLGLMTGFLWTFYARVCREAGENLTSAELTAYSMWQSSFWLLPLMIWDLATHQITYNFNTAAVQVYAILFGGVIAYLFWYTALRYWSTSRVLLFYNLIAPCTMTWAYFCIGERVSPTFWTAMILVGFGILLLEWNNVKSFMERSVPQE